MVGQWSPRNVAFYGWSCWIVFCFIRGTKGRERLYMMGFSVWLLWPLRVLRPEWAVALEFIKMFGYAVSLLAAITLLLQPSKVVDIAPKTASPRR